MFMQIHMLQSMPPGNLNRDETGQPKKCLFGGVTRGRISSQCLKRNIRRSVQMKEAFGDALADRTRYLPQMVADEIREDPALGIPEEELEKVMQAIASRFHKEERGAGEGEEGAEDSSAKDSPQKGGAGMTAQLVFFPQPFARKIAELVGDLRKEERAYAKFIGRPLKPKASKEEDKALKPRIAQFVKDASKASKCLTVDIGLFGRMTTSDLVANVEAACQVAHAISTHETMIEGDYFTAMDERKHLYVESQVGQAAASFMGTGDTVTFFNASVYYKYLNLDLAAFRKHLPSLSDEHAAQAAGVLLAAAAFATPTGKQNSFASHSVPELILVELSDVKRPISYANAFLQAVEGGPGRNLMAESAKALAAYVDTLAVPYAPADMARVLLAIGPASIDLAAEHERADTMDKLVDCVVRSIQSDAKAGASA